MTQAGTGQNPPLLASALADAASPLPASAPAAAWLVGVDSESGLVVAEDDALVSGGPATRQQAKAVCIYIQSCES